AIWISRVRHILVEDILCAPPQRPRNETIIVRPMFVIYNGRSGLFWDHRYANRRH
ncbi:hypothetical protein MCOR06_011805, partial [Pyricularia oryzae]